MSKKNTTISIRIDIDAEEQMNILAKQDDRTIGYIARQLINEALEARGLVKKPSKKK